MTAQRVSVGRVVATHGWGGEVSVLPLTDFPQRFRSGTRYILAGIGEEKWLTLKSARVKGKKLLLTFAEINSQEEAARLKGAYLQVRPEEVEPLPPDRYYVFQLLGARVYTESGEFLGEITDVWHTGANDVWQVKGLKEKEILIPALKEVIRDINLEEKHVVVKPLPGLFD